jgi:RNA recognition motif-containing protein
VDHPEERKQGPAGAEYESEAPEEGKRARRHQMLNKSLKRKETVYVGNLFFDMTAEDLRTAMEKFGVVEAATIIHDNRGLSKGCV